MSSDFRLMASEKNAVFYLVVESGMEPGDFGWRDRKGTGTIKAYSVLVHTPSKYYFEFKGEYGEWSPGRHQRIEFKNIGKPPYDSARHSLVKGWWQTLKREI